MNTTKALTRTEVREESSRKIIASVNEKRERLAKLLVGQDVDRFITVALQVVVSNPDLLDADGPSVLAAISEAATHGLEPVGPLGDGAIIAYKGIATFQPMYRGLMKLARRSGEVSSIDAQVVYENDDYLVELGTEPRITHRPTPLGQPRGAYVGVYAYARLKTGELVIVEMNLADIEKVRNASMSYRNARNNDSVWHKWPEPMMMKSAIKRLMKKLPLQPSANEALALDDRIEAGETEEVKRPPRQVSGAKGRLLSRIGVAPVEASETPQDAEGDNDVPAGPNGQEGPLPARSVDPEDEAIPDAEGEKDGAGSEELTEAEIEELLEDPTDVAPGQEGLGLDEK